jgi:N-formylglutamate amidohydrolase
VQALQIEVARDLYMDERRIERLSGFSTVQRAITCFIAGLAALAPTLGRG